MLTDCTVYIRLKAQEMLKKESIFPYKQMKFLFYVGHLDPGHFGPSLEQLILVHDKFLFSALYMYLSKV